MLGFALQIGRCQRLGPVDAIDNPALHERDRVIDAIERFPEKDGRGGWSTPTPVLAVIEPNGDSKALLPMGCIGRGNRRR